MQLNRESEMHVENIYVIHKFCQIYYWKFHYGNFDIYGTLELTLQPFYSRREQKARCILHWNSYF